MLRRILLFMIIAALGLSACSTLAAPPATPTPTTTPPLVLVDGLKHTLTLSQPAGRIVSLAPSNTELLYAVGAGAQVAGRDEFSDYPAEAKALPSVGGSMSKYNYEAITNLKPDLVLAAEINTPEQVDALQKLGLNVYYLSNPTTLEGLYANIQIVAELSGHTPQAASLVEALKKRVAAVTGKTAQITNKPSVFYELDATDPNAPYTAGPGTFVDLLVGMAGGQNIGGSLKDAWAQLSLEKIVVDNPQIILLGDAAYGSTPEAVAKRAGWEGLQAIKAGQVYAFDDNLVSRPGPRLVDGLETLARLLHPELFK